MATTLAAYPQEYHAGLLTASQSKDTEVIRAHVHKYLKPGSVFIRPSGNPITDEQWISMMRPNHEGQMMRTEMISAEVLEVETAQEIADGDAGVLVYTTHDKFTFCMGEDQVKTGEGCEMNDDIARQATEGQEIG